VQQSEKRKKMRQLGLIFIIFVICVVFTCLAEGETLPGEELTKEQLEAKVRELERRIVGLEVILSHFKSFAALLADPELELEIESIVDSILEREPEGTNIIISVILVSALLLLVIGNVFLTIRLSRR